MPQSSIKKSDDYFDVVQLCALLQCLGFSKHAKDGCLDGIPCSISINFQASGIDVLFDNADFKQYSKKYGRSLLGTLPKTHRDRLTKELQSILECIKEHNESDIKINPEALANRSTSMLDLIDLKTPEKRLQLKCETPKRYRSLDALTAKDEVLPAPGPLTKDKKLQFVSQRQGTYFWSPPLEASTVTDKTISSIQLPLQSIRNKLEVAEKYAEDLRHTLSTVLRDFKEDKHDVSMSSLFSDVLKNTVVKVPKGLKIQSASSPNLVDLGLQDNYTNKFRIESASTSNLVTKSTLKDEKISKRTQIPLPKNYPYMLNRKDKPQDIKSGQYNSFPKTNTVTTMRKPTINLNGSTDINAAIKMKFSLVKSKLPKRIKKD